jgi:hypothetical protein
MTRKFFFAIVLTLTLVGGFVAGRASAAQPHMAAAMDHLRLARKELNLALADKGGHRAKALELVNSAIDEVQAGIDYARR